MSASVHSFKKFAESGGQGNRSIRARLRRGFAFFCQSFLIEVQERIRFNWVREMVKLNGKCLESVVFSKEKIKLIWMI